MKVGKIPESILERSVIRQIHNKRPEVLMGSGVGEDCAAIQLAADEVFVLSTDPITGTARDIGNLAIRVTNNDLASAGAEPVGVLLTILLPERTTEPELKEIILQAESACREDGIQIVGGHTEVTAQVKQPIVSVTGLGKVKKGHLVSTGGAEPGMDFVMTKAIALEGTSILAKDLEEDLKGHFPDCLVERAAAFDQELSVLPESRVAAAFGVAAMHDVTEGGIYGAIWEMCQASGAGCRIDLKKIAIRQESVEICEYLGLNPYKLISSGCMLMAAADGNGLVMALARAGIEACVIGKATDSNDRILFHGEEERFLEMPQTDELYRLDRKQEVSDG